jgi:hypothetical protein
MKISCRYKGQSLDELSGSKFYKEKIGNLGDGRIIPPVRSSSKIVSNVSKHSYFLYILENKSNLDFPEYVQSYNKTNGLNR